MHENVRRNTMLQQSIVEIEKQNVIAMTGCETVQTRCKLVAINIPANNFDGGMHGGDLVEDTRTVVRRRVIDNDAFDIWIGLRENRLDSVSDETPEIIIVDNDAD